MSDSTSLPLVTIEIDGQTVQAPQGSMIMEAADRAKIYIPRFCYHEKLSIAANCRMCLVEVEKSRKPLPACATPITEGMKILTRSAMALESQRDVMQFLLINHPLDCPICDQGGECELQDLSLGFGRDYSDFNETKRSVDDVDIGPLISTNMTRCIHCTRCIRFGTEIAGIKELGLTNRGENAVVTSYIESSLQSELSGNVIDLCPVGALTSKPFRYQARPWELMQKPGLGLHDGAGSHLYYHLRRNKVFRAVPRVEESINETWLSDRDRFSCHGLYHNRLEKPLASYDGKWETGDWSQAFHYLSKQLKELKASFDSKTNFGVGYINPSASLEEMYLFQKVLEDFGIDQIIYNQHQTDSHFQPLVGLPIAATELEFQECFLFFGSHMVFEQPILAAKVRKALQNNALAMAINPLDYEFHFEVPYKSIVAPHKMLEEIVALLKAVLSQDKNLTLTAEHTQILMGLPYEPQTVHQEMAKALLAREKRIIILGAQIQQHPQASTLYAFAKMLAEVANCHLAYLPHGANVMAAQKLFKGQQTDSSAPKVVFLYDVDPALDVLNSQHLLQQLKQADFVVAFSAYRSEALEKYANVILPIAAFPENSGTWINLEGRWQFQAAPASALGDSRPGWKVLRVLANCLELPGYDFTSVEEVAEKAKIQVQNSNLTDSTTTELASLTAAQAYTSTQAQENELFILNEWPLYRIDSLVRHSEPLQQTPINLLPAAYMNALTLQSLGFKEHQLIQVKQHHASATLPVHIHEQVPEGVVLIPASYNETQELVGLSGCVKVGNT